MLTRNKLSGCLPASARCYFQNTTTLGLLELRLIKVNYTIIIIIPYPRERGPMGGAPYIGPRLGDGPIFEVLVLHLDAKERPGKLPTLSS